MPNGIVINGPHWVDSKYSSKIFFKGVTKGRDSNGHVKRFT